MITVFRDAPEANKEIIEASVSSRRVSTIFASRREPVQVPTNRHAALVAVRLFYTAKTKEQVFQPALRWCGRRDLNPYVEDTRPSNVRVCRFRHSRNGLSIIQHTFLFVNRFFEFFSIFFAFYRLL